MSKHPSVFIVSSGRAGSTLLQAILNASGQICIPKESDFIGRAYPFFYQKSTYQENDYKVLADMFCRSSQDKGWGIDKSDIVRQLKKHSPQTLADVFGRICEIYHKAEGTQDLVWGIKRPVLIASMKRVISTYPDAKIIHICRDGRDVYLSYKHIHKNGAIKFGPNNAFTGGLYWVSGLRYIDAFKKEGYVDNLLEIKYESLLCSPKETLESLSEFVGINYNASAIDDFNQGKSKRAVAPKSFMSTIHPKLSQKIDPSNTKKYAKEMTRFEIFIFELIASPLLKKYGYKLEYRFLGFPLFSPIRAVLYSIAMGWNGYRYKKRDERYYRNSTESIQELKN